MIEPHVKLTVREVEIFKISKHGKELLLIIFRNKHITYLTYN